MATCVSRSLGLAVPGSLLVLNDKKAPPPKKMGKGLLAANKANLTTQALLLHLW